MCITVADADAAVLHGAQVHQALRQILLALVCAQIQARHLVELAQLHLGDPLRVWDGDTVGAESGDPSVGEGVEPEVGVALGRLLALDCKVTASSLRVAGPKVGHGHEGLPGIGVQSRDLL